MPLADKTQTYTIPTTTYGYSTPAANGYCPGNVKVLAGKYTATANHVIDNTGTYKLTLGQLPEGGRLFRMYMITDAVVNHATTPSVVDVGTDTDADFFAAGLNFGTSALAAIDKWYGGATAAKTIPNGAKLVVTLTGDTTTQTWASGKYIEWVFEFIVP